MPGYNIKVIIPVKLPCHSTERRGVIMITMAIILIMLFLAVLLTVSYLPRLKQPQFTKKRYHFETAQDLTPELDKDNPPDVRIEALDSPPIRYSIPNKYNEDKIALLVRDPEWLFAYWEISNETRQNLVENHQEIYMKSIPVLRVYNISQGSDSFFDIDLAEEATRCHIHVQKANNTYYVMFGRKKTNGEFIPLLLSNIVQTPRSSVSDILDMDWLPPLEYAHLLYKDSGIFSSGEFIKERND